MRGRWSNRKIVVDAPARERFHASSGMGIPRDDGGVALTWVEAAYLLDRGDLADIDGADFPTFLEDQPDEVAIDRWLVYHDLRERGYYVSTAYDPGELPEPTEPTFVVHPRGSPPTSDEVDFRVAVVSETTSLLLSEMEVVTLAIADDEGEITYIGIDSIEPTGTSQLESWTAPEGERSGNRVVVENPPEAMVDPAFFGRQLDEVLLLNPLEARYLVENDRLEASIEKPTDATDHRRYQVYATLRDRGCVPRSGFKFGADFRVYTDVSDASDPGHSSYLVEVLPVDMKTTPRTLSRAVRLAGGVRKRQLIALVDGTDIRWIALDRVRP